MFKKYLSLLTYFISFLPIVYISFNRDSVFLSHIENIDINSLKILFVTFVLIFLSYIQLSHSFKYLNRYRTLLYLLVPFSILMLVSLPLFSVDVYGYLIVGKNLSISIDNPYVVAKNYNILNTWNSLIDPWWITQPSFNGPLFNIILIPFGFISNNILVSLYTFKFFALTAYLLSLYIVYLIFRDLNLKNYKPILLIALNPALLINLLLDVHSEMFIVLFTLLGIYFIGNKYLSSLSNSLVIAIKFIGLLFIPIFFIKDKRIDLKNGLLSIVIVFVVMFLSLKILNVEDPVVLLKNRHFSTSTVCFYTCSPFVKLTNLIFHDYATIVRAFSTLLIGVFIVYKYLYLKFSPIEYVFWIITTILFVYMTWLTPWYLSLPIVLSLIISEENPEYYKLSFILTFYSMFHYFGIL